MNNKTALTDRRMNSKVQELVSQFLLNTPYFVSHIPASQFESVANRVSQLLSDATAGITAVHQIISVLNARRGTT
jgi:hypothetical protein